VDEQTHWDINEDNIKNIKKVIVRRLDKCHTRGDINRLKKEISLEEK